MRESKATLNSDIKLNVIHTNETPPRHRSPFSTFAGSSNMIGKIESVNCRAFKEQLAERVSVCLST